MHGMYFSSMQEQMHQTHSKLLRLCAGEKALKGRARRSPILFRVPGYSTDTLNNHNENNNTNGENEILYP